MSAFPFSTVSWHAFKSPGCMILTVVPVLSLISTESICPMITWSAELLTATMRMRPTQLCRGLAHKTVSITDKIRKRNLLFTGPLPFFLWTTTSRRPEMLHLRPSHTTSHSSIWTFWPNQGHAYKELMGLSLQVASDLTLMLQRSCQIMSS